MEFPKYKASVDPFHPVDQPPPKQKHRVHRLPEGDVRQQQDNAF
jgi:hypothetical protein